MAGGNEWLIGIDFGTSFCKAAAAPKTENVLEACQHVRPLLLASPDQSGPSWLLPSIMFIEDGVIYFGPQASQRAQAAAADKREPLRSFKMLLGAGDLQTLLNMPAPRKVDPAGLFTHRDLIILFLAYFIRRVEKSAATDPDIGPDAQLRFQYTRPGWVTQRTSHDHAEMLGLMRQASGVAKAYASDLDQDTLPCDAAVEALLQSTQTSDIRVDAGIFEANAVAAAFMPEAAGRHEALLIVDSGAGTTDFGAYFLNREGLDDTDTLRETIRTAGDEVDFALLNLFLSKAKFLKTVKLQANFWRYLVQHVRALKEDIILNDKGSVSFADRSIKIAYRDLKRDKDYVRVTKVIRTAFRNFRQKAVARARQRGVSELSLIATGGSAQLPFVQSLLKEKKKLKGVRIANVGGAPDWARQSPHADSIVPGFNQLAVAIGGAIARDPLLIRSPASMREDEPLPEPDERFSAGLRMD